MRPMQTTRPIPSGIGSPVGKPAIRLEDDALLRGSARFLDDIRLPGEAHAAFLRSTEPHAGIRAIDARQALRRSGVVAVLTGRDLAADGVGGIPWEVVPPAAAAGGRKVAPGDPAIARPQPAMPADRALYAGQIVAMVVAETADAARDGLEAITVDWEPLDAVIDVEDALADGAPVIDPQFPDNICFRVAYGDREATDAAFARAAHVTRIRHVHNRGVGAPIETRGYIGSWDPVADKFTLHATAGKPHPVRDTLATFCFFCAPEKIRVVVPRLGGGFGAKNVLHAEQVLVLWAARRLGRPVRWISDRSESFLGDVHSRDLVGEAEYAFDSDHRLLAMRVINNAALGAYMAPRAVNPVRNSIKIAPSVYDVPTGYLEARAVLTNTVPTCPIRGAGEPEGQYIPERLMDASARELGLDRAELRRANLIAADALPYRTVTEFTYDSGEFEANLGRALELADREGYGARRTDSRGRGLLRGFAVCNTIEALAAGLDEQADIRCGPDGRVELRIGSMSNGQGHDTVYAQIAAGMLGIEMDRVQVIQGDTDDIAYGTGTGACRSLVVGGSAVQRTAERLIELGRNVAAHHLEAAPEDIEFAGGRFSVAGTDRAIAFDRIVERQGGLAASDRFVPGNFSYPTGAHCCEVEVDPETGAARVDRYVMVHDCGTPVNPMLVEAQLRGGVVHGLGQAFSEHVVYDRQSGQILSGSFLDYGLPRADDIPRSCFTCELRPVPAASNPLGAKSIGEAGVAVSPILAVNAVIDALAPLGVTDISMPMTPARVRAAIDGAAATQEPEDHHAASHQQ